MIIIRVIFAAKGVEKGAGPSVRAGKGTTLYLLWGQFSVLKFAADTDSSAMLESASRDMTTYHSMYPWYSL